MSAATDYGGAPTPPIDVAVLSSSTKPTSSIARTGAGHVDGACGRLCFVFGIQTFAQLDAGGKNYACNVSLKLWE